MKRTRLTKVMILFWVGTVNCAGLCAFWQDIMNWFAQWDGPGAPLVCSDDPFSPDFHTCGSMEG